MILKAKQKALTYYIQYGDLFEIQISHARIFVTLKQTSFHEFFTIEISYMSYMFDSFLILEIYIFTVRITLLVMY